MLVHMTTPKLLITWHSRTGASEAMAKAAHEAAGERAEIRAAADVAGDHIIAASGYLFVCPENLATMSGMMKDMFDRTYYDALGKIEGRPYATIIAAGSDGEGAQRQIDRIAKGWRLRRVAEPVIVNFQAQDAETIWAPKTVPSPMLAQCRALGEAMAEGLEAGVF